VSCEATTGETAHHYYPLRRRSEKNLHPYTKLQWTNPADLLQAKNQRRGTSLLKALSTVDEHQKHQEGFIGMVISGGNGDNTQGFDYAGVQDSEDEEYVPGMTQLNEQESQIVVDEYMDIVRPRPAVSVGRADRVDWVHQGIAPMSARKHDGGCTYRHLAAQRRTAIRQQQTNGQKQSNDDADDLVLPSLEDLLGGTAACHIDNGSDPYEVPRSFLTHKEPPPKDSNIDPASSSSLIRSSSSRNRHYHNRRRLVSRKQQLVSTPPRHSASLSSSSSDEQLPTAKARKLNKISRHHIRGILPFSFMRGLNEQKESEIQEEVHRWQNQATKIPTKRRVLSSSPPPHRPSSPSHSQQQQQQQLTASATAHFEFEFLDIYQWQFPEPLADRGPDFLRVAARECRRRSLHNSNSNSSNSGKQADDAWKKHVCVEPRSLGEVEEGDVAQGIVAAWRLGVIDVRRVFFCCDSDDSEEEGVSGFVWDEGFGNGRAGHREDPPFIVISDDEAVEDNRIADAGGGRGIGRNIGISSRKAGGRKDGGGCKAGHSRDGGGCKVGHSRDGGRRRQAPGTGLT
ncbi:hypothetical protein GGF37_002725, partial [Kickxella alabastrina]